MKQACLRGVGDIVLEEVEEAALREDEVRIAVCAAGICRSDVHGFSGLNSRRAPGVVMGHEVAGRVIEVGPAVADVHLGDPVAVNPVVSCGACASCLTGLDNLCDERRLYGCTPELPGGFAESMVVRRGNVVPVPLSMPLELASLVEPLAVGTRAANRLAIEEGGLLVVGGGIVGIGAALAAQRCGARVLLAELDEDRRAVASRVGLDARRPDEVPRGVRFDGAIDCVGFAETLGLAIQRIRDGGTVVAVGLAQESVPIPMAGLVMGERQIVGSAVYTRADYLNTASWLGRVSLGLDALIELRVDLDGLPAAIAGYAAGANNALKTVVVPT